MRFASPRKIFRLNEEECMAMDDPLDRNISKLLRGARSPEPARSGAEQRVFADAMARLAAQKTAAQPRRIELWAAIVAVAACLIFGVVLFSPFFLTKPRVEVARQTPKTVTPEDQDAPKQAVIPPVTEAFTPTVTQLNPPEDTPAPVTKTLSDRSTLEVAAGSRVEILEWPWVDDPEQDRTKRATKPNSHRPEIRIRSGAMTLDIAQGPGRVKIHSPAGDVLASAAKLNISVEKQAASVDRNGGQATSGALSKMAMIVAVNAGEAIIREISGTEQLVASGEKVTVGGISGATDVAENWRSGQLVPKLQSGQPGDPLEVRRHTVKATITEQIALVEVDETFYNPGDQRLEGTFFFPLPHDSAICRLALYVGDNLMEGEIAEAQRARRTFEALIVQQVDPALLEWAGGNMFKMRVFPIEPKSEKRVLISYYEVLKKDHNRIDFTYPLASDTTQKHPVGEINLNITVDSTPAIETAATPDFDSKIVSTPNHLDVAYSSKNVTPAKDFRLQYQCAKGQPLVTVPYWHARRNEGYFLMIFSPDLEQTASEKRRNSDFVFVVDKSTGMGARQLALETRTVKTALGRLQPTDRFGIVAYDAVSQTFRPELIDATPQNLAEAGAWLDTLEAFGGSDLTQAWNAAAKLCAPGVTQIVYHGSGMSSLSSTKAGTLLANADAAFKGKDIHIHCLPAGAVQDLTFLNELAKKYSGTVRPVKSADDASLGAAELLEDFSWPLYRNVAIDFGDLPVSDVFPAQLPNVTAGRQLFVFGKYKTPVDGALKLTASRDGEPYTQELQAKFGQDATRSFVPRLWAQQRISQLQLEAASASGEDSAAITKDIVETSKRYRVMSQYTSFIVLESAEDYLRYGIERRPDEFSGDQELPEALTVELEAAAAPAANARRGEPAEKGKADREELRECPRPFSKDTKNSGESLRRAAGRERSDVVVPPDILAKAELGDHFETVNPDQLDMNGTFGTKQGGGRRLMLKRAGGIAGKETDKDGAAYEARKDVKKQADLLASIEQDEIDTVPWERQDIFPVFDRPSLRPLSDKAPRSTARAMKILNNLSQRYESLAAKVTHYNVDKEGKETKQGREWVVALDFKRHAFVSRALGEDFADVCDGAVRVRLFPQLKYAARRKTIDNDVPATAHLLPGFLCPWADKLDHEWIASVDKDEENEVIVRLVQRNNAQAYTLLYLKSANGPVQKIEIYERQRIDGKNQSVNTQTVFCEELKDIPTVYRTVQHGNHDKTVAVIRLTDVRVNAALEADTFKADIPGDWAVRDLDTEAMGAERRPLSQPVNPSPNFGPPGRR
jgi:hypothetical protein